MFYVFAMCKKYQVRNRHGPLSLLFSKQDRQSSSRFGSSQLSLFQYSF